MLYIKFNNPAKVEEGSLKNQEQMLHAELRRRNEQHAEWGIHVSSYVDEGISGKDTNRPAFQRMMQDIEMGKIQAVMFTELSRLSRSLKDFLNIFEFAQKNNCDLVCLKTEIDTTSPYKSLITKILMIFAEFEREMTSRRTASNAYERSKRGLANGGAAPLGYRRMKQKKGHLFIDEKEKKIVEDIFQTYMRGESIRKTTDYIIKKYGTDTPRLKKMSGTKVYAILTNKTYIGIRVINTHDKVNREEVPAVWEPIIDRETFEKVQALLRKNRDTFHPRGNGRYLYHFSGLFRCGKCGEKLQGQSAYSCTDKPHYYYSHKGTCAKGGINRIDAETAHSLVFGWLRNLAEERDQFKRLQDEGRQRMEEELSQLEEERKRLEIEKEGIGEQIEARIRELVKSKSETVRKSIEKSIENLEAFRREVEEKSNYVNQTISSLENLMKNDQELFTAYSKNIREALAQVERSGQAPGTEDENVRESASDKAKSSLKALIPSLLMEEADIKIALSGVNRKALHSSEFGLAPSGKQSANKIISLIEDSLQLPALLQIRSKAVLERLYNKEKLSVREIAGLTETSHSTILSALSKFGIPQNGNGHKRRGQIPFGFEYKDFKLIKSKEEQEIIRMIRQYRVNGLSLRKIADELNQKLVPTKNCGVWQANTVKKILERS